MPRRASVLGLTKTTRGKTSWKNLTEVKSSCNGSERGIRGKLRMQARALRNNARYVEPWLELLPSSDYGSIVCGGLKLVLNV
jgi:hypothetical protein